MAIFPGQSLLERLNADQRIHLGQELFGIVQDEESEHQGYFRSLKIWWEWHEAAPAVTRKTFPFDGASNIVAPVIQIWSRNTIARLYNPIQALNKTWVGTTENAAFQPYVDPITRFLNNGAQPGGRFDISIPLYDAVAEMVPIGSSVWKLTWQDRKRWLLHPRTGKPIRVALGSGPVVEQIPAERLLWKYGRCIQEAEMIIEQHLMSWNDLKRMVQLDDWDKEAVQDTQGQRTTSYGSSNVEESKRKMESRESVRTDLYDIRTISIEMPYLTASTGVVIPDTDQDTVDLKTVRYVIHLCMDNRRVLQIRSFPYLVEGWNYYDVYVDKRAGRGSSGGLAKKGENIQRGITTMLNQGIDAVTLANSIKGITTDPNVYNQKFSINKFIKVSAMDSVAPFETSKNIVPDITMMNFLSNIGERLVNVPDPMQGQETRMGGHPAPATSTLTQLAQGDKVLAMASFFLRRQLSRTGEDIWSLYQQFETDDNQWIEKTFSQDDADKVLEALTGTADFFAGNLNLDLHAMSETANPDVERTKALTLSQFGAQYSALMMQYMNVAASPQTPPPVKQIAMQSIETQTALYKRVLEASDIKEVEQFIIDAEKAYAQFAQQLFQPPAPPGLPPGGGPGAGPAGATGPQPQSEAPGSPPLGPVEPSPAAPPGEEGPFGGVVGSRANGAG